MDKRGFTILEVIIAALMLSVAVAAFFCSFLMASETAGRVGRNSMAYYLARDLIDDLRNAVDGNYWPPTVPPYLETANPKGDLSAGNIVDDIGSTPLGIKYSGTREYDITNIDVPGGGLAVDYKMITVTVEWTEP